MTYNKILNLRAKLKRNDQLIGDIKDKDYNTLTIKEQGLYDLWNTNRIMFELKIERLSEKLLD
jgi:hypothetical protein